MHCIQLQQERKAFRRFQLIHLAHRQADPGIERLDAGLNFFAAGHMGENLLFQHQALLERPFSPEHRRGIGVPALEAQAAVGKAAKLVRLAAELHG